MDHSCSPASHAWGFPAETVPSHGIRTQSVYFQLGNERPRAKQGAEDDIEDLRMETPIEVVRTHGRDILASEGMQLEKTFMQHGDVSVYAHSVGAACMSIRIARALNIRLDERSLVRGALLHDYFLYDWHVPGPENHRHATMHARYALRNAERDFVLNDIERNVIERHMFPVNLRPPSTKEAAVLCLADKICATQETVAGFAKAALAFFRGPANDL